jgi:hypothetical protein
LGVVSAGSVGCLLILCLMTCGNEWPRCYLLVRPDGSGIPGGCRRMTVLRCGASFTCCARA